ncbi:transposable element Tcb1 transposase [Elysia marginata]|uniref:Transposable element Tcb1 transposase n=1 Tax=Elysia marginata TaxID=1093978 RepID=A0AAV4HE05_9GAST|nr:transposable element Tcb1 transposase [Elysia marginata]
MPRLSEVDRHRALGLLQAGLPITEVSLRMNVNRTTIFRLRQRLHKTDTVSDRSRSGRPSPTPSYAMSPGTCRIQWRSIVFSDESRICVDHDDGRVGVWRRSGERYQADCVREHDSRGRLLVIFVISCLQQSRFSTALTSSESVSPVTVLMSSFHRMHGRPRLLPSEA